MTKPNLTYASFGIRLLAYLIDFIILSIVTSIVWAIFKLPIPERNVIAEFNPLILFSNPLGSFAGWLYFAILESSSLQGSLGKYILGLKVTDENGNRISFANASVRYFGKIFSSLLLFFGFLYILLNPKKQALHDALASTFVVSGIQKVFDNSKQESQNTTEPDNKLKEKPNLKNDKELLLDLFKKNILTEAEYTDKINQIEIREKEMITKFKNEQIEQALKQNNELFERELEKRMRPLIIQIEELKKSKVLSQLEFEDKKIIIEQQCRLELELEIKKKGTFENENQNGYLWK